jgi:hypothetical protein
MVVFVVNIDELRFMAVHTSWILMKRAVCMGNTYESKQNFSDVAEAMFKEEGDRLLLDCKQNTVCEISKLQGPSATPATLSVRALHRLRATLKHVDYLQHRAQERLL